MSRFISDDHMGIDPDMRRWMDQQIRSSKDKQRTNILAAARVKNRELEDAKIWARKYIRREEILDTSNRIERPYLEALNRYIQQFAFTASMLGVDDSRFEKVLQGGRRLQLRLVK